MLRFAFLLLLWLPHARASDIETSLRGDVLVLGDERWLHATENTPRSSLSDGILIGGADLSASRSGVAIEARPELRALWSEAASSSTSSADYIPLAGPKRWADLTTHLVDSSRSQAYLDWQRLTLSYRDAGFEALVGRKIFATGVLKIFPVWNKFSRPLPFLPSPILLYGQDQIAAAAQSEAFSARGAFLADPDRRDNTYWFEGGWTPTGFELHLLAAYWWQKRVTGLAGATDLWGATWRAESLFIENHIQLGLGFERALDEKWNLLIEAFYQDEGVTSRAEYQLELPSRFSILRARNYSAWQLSYKLRETLILSASAIVNELDGSVFADLKIDDSLTENSDLILELKGPIGGPGDEFSTAALRFPDDGTLGVPSQLSLAYKRFF